MLIKKFGPHFVAVPMMMLALVLAVPVQAYFVPSTHQAATRVLGQPNFTSSSAVTTQNGMFSPSDVALDATTHKVFVADGQNNRVLRFASIYALANGAAAEAVLGQSLFTTNASVTTQSGMKVPESVFVDAGGRLWVADTFNSRVLRFDNASSIASGANASAVLGQANFTSSGQAATQAGMNDPAGLFVDGSGRLWVADTSNSRVLRFDNAAAKANGANADGVLGQPNFTNNTFTTTQNRMAFPYGVAVDTGGRLWVADMVGNRVLRFDNAAAKANGANADGVLGQTLFTTNVNATSQNGMFEPFDVALDPSGRLYVADHSNNRILVYNAAAGLANGSNASYVLGQTLFTTNTTNNGGISATTLNSPFGLFYDPIVKVLWAADSLNHRVLMYGKPSVYQAFSSTAANDGWILETAENSNAGGTMNAAGTLRLGDDAANRQYRSILYFNTQALPDTAVIRSATLRIKKAGVVGSDPLLTFGNLLADMKKGPFGLAALESGDFQSPASANNIGSFASIGGGLYRLMVPAADYTYINLTGVTQFRLRFALDDNNNNITDIDAFFAGDAAVSTQRPVLTIEYSLP